MKAQNAVKEATDTAVDASSTNLYDKNNSYIADMDEVFSENMGLMLKLHLSYDLQAPIANATTASL